jgi:hypothetical protein
MSNFKSNKTILYLARAYPVLLLLVGLGLMILSSLLHKVGIPSWFSLLVGLIYFNYILALKIDFEERFWSIIKLTKLHHFIFGFLVGLLPIAISSYVVTKDLSFTQNISLKSVGLTLAIVSWEEFWFRGILLDYSAKIYSPIGGMLIFSMMFVLLHVLNPNLNLLEAAPDLFFGSLLLSLCYFVFESIWAPIGIHFSNNYFESLWATNGEFSMLTMVGCEMVLCMIFFIIYRSKKYRLDCEEFIR